MQGATLLQIVIKKLRRSESKTSDIIRSRCLRVVLENPSNQSKASIDTYPRKLRLPVVPRD